MERMTSRSETFPRAGIRGGGFTLVELLVVIAIIAMLVTLLLPAVQSAREAARRASCINNLRQVGLGLLNYESSKGTFPFGSDHPVGTTTWAAMILPFVEAQAHYDLFDFSRPMRDRANQRGRTTPVDIYMCASDPTSGNNPILDKRGDSPSFNPAESAMLSYPGSMGPTHPDNCPFCPDDKPSPDNWCCQGCNFGSFGSGCGMEDGSFAGMFGRFQKPIALKRVSDGLSKTVMAGETIPSHYIWNGAFVPNFPVSSMSIPINTMEQDGNLHGGHTLILWAITSGFKSYHPGGANFVMGDGSVHFFSEGIDHRLYANLGTRAGNEPVSIP